jgi:hypothetical protein
MNAFVPCHSFTPKSVSKSSVMATLGTALATIPAIIFGSFHFELSAVSTAFSNASSLSGLSK